MEKEIADVVLIFTYVNQNMCVFLQDKVRLGGKVRELARVVFGTGHFHRAITVSSNGNFVRSAAQQVSSNGLVFCQPLFSGVVFGICYLFVFTYIALPSCIHTSIFSQGYIYF